MYNKPDTRLDPGSIAADLSKWDPISHNLGVLKCSICHAFRHRDSSDLGIDQEDRKVFPLNLHFDYCPWRRSHEYLKKLERMVQV